MSKLDNTKQEAVNLIASAMRDALKTLSQEALDAKRLISQEAASAAKVLVTRNADGSSDHDAITTLVGSVAALSNRLTEKFDDLKADIKEIKDGAAAKIADHEIRITGLETEKTRSATLITVVGAIITLLVGLLVYHLFQQ